MGMRRMQTDKMRDKGKCIFKGMIVAIWCGVFSGGLFCAWVYWDVYMRRRRQLKKLSSFHDMMTKWVAVRETDHSLSECIAEMGIRTVAVYGMQTIGKCLEKELRNSKVELLYAIDAKAECIYSDLKILRPEDELPDVDAIIVTSIHAFEEIRNGLAQGISDRCRIINLSELVDKAYYRVFSK